MTPEQHYAKAVELTHQLDNPPRLVGEGWRDKLIAEATLYATLACVPGHVVGRAGRRKPPPDRSGLGFGPPNKPMAPDWRVGGPA